MTCCPHCGYNLERDRPRVIGELAIDPRGTASYAGRDLKLTGAEHILLQTLAGEHPRPVSTGVLCERLGTDTNDPNRLVAVLACRANRKAGRRLVVVPTDGLRALDV